MLERGQCFFYSLTKAPIPPELTIIMMIMIMIMIFSTVLKRFCPGDSKNVFVLALAHIKPELELFEVWEIMVPQIIITIITNVINFKQLLLGF